MDWCDKMHWIDIYALHRLLEDKEKTKELLKMIENTGVKAITVHCRYRDQRSSTPARWDEFKEAISVVKNIPVALNGDVFQYKDIESIKEKTGMMKG